MSQHGVKSTDSGMGLKRLQSWIHSYKSCDLRHTITTPVCRFFPCLYTYIYYCVCNNTYLRIIERIKSLNTCEVLRTVHMVSTQEILVFLEVVRLISVGSLAQPTTLTKSSLPYPLNPTILHQNQQQKELSKCQWQEQWMGN